LQCKFSPSVLVFLFYMYIVMTTANIVPQNYQYHIINIVPQY